MAYIKNPTEAQKQEWIKQAKEQEEQLQNMIKNLTESYQEKPEKIAELLAFGSKFYKYSLRNNMLVYSQNPHATYVQSFKAWKDLGYPPKKGEHGVKVYVPVQATILKIGHDLVPLEQATKEQKNQYKAGEIESITKKHYKVGTVFDIAQTAYPKELYPTLFYMGYSSEIHEKLTKALTEFAQQSLNCDVVVENLKSISLRGTYVPGMIKLNEKLEDTQKLSTLAHEMGHAFMQHDLTKSMAQKELEADSLGIMLESYLGLEVTESRKRHLAEHYREYQREYQEQPEKRESFGEVMNNVYKRFRDAEPELSAYIEKYVPKPVMPDVQQKPARQTARMPQSDIYDTIKREVQITDYAALHGFSVRRIGTYYTLQEHDSVRIDPGRNCFWRNSGIDPVTHKAMGDNVSGSVIDFAALFVHDGSLHETLKELQGMVHIPDFTQPPAREKAIKPQRERDKKSLQENLPPRGTNMRRAYAYLTKSRYIDQDVVQDFVNKKMLYQDIKGNCVFVAYDDNGNPNFATFRGTLTDRRFLGDVPGNDYKRDFYINNGSDKLIVTESVIDAMSVMSILKGQGIDYHEYDYLAMAGTGKSEALLFHLQETPKKEVLLSLDHDVGGIAGMAEVSEKIGELGQEVKVTFHIPDIEQKDWNGELTRAAKKMKPMSSIPYLEEQPLPKICQCAIQSTENVEEKGFRMREGKHQYRLVEKVDGLIQPMDINRNIIYTNPKELETLVPPMYVMVKYSQLEEPVPLEVKSSEIQSLAKEEPKATPNLSAGEIDIKDIQEKYGIYNAIVELEGKETELGIWKQGEQFFIETGYAFEDTLEKHELNEAAVKVLAECYGEGITACQDGLITPPENISSLTGDRSQKTMFLEQMQKQELKRNQTIMTKQPGMSIEIEL